jgi:hypothetical protein
MKYIFWQKCSSCLWNVAFNSLFNSIFPTFYTTIDLQQLPFFVPDTRHIRLVGVLSAFRERVKFQNGLSNSPKSEKTACQQLGIVFCM